MKKRWMLFVSILLLLSFTAIVSGCSKDNEEEKKNTEQKTENVKNEDVEKEEKTEEPEAPVEKEAERKEEAQKSAVMLSVTSSSVAENDVTFHMPWEASKDGKYEATIDGKGENGIEEGQGTLVVKEKATGKLTKYELNKDSIPSDLYNTDSHNITLKEVEWGNNDTLYVVVGQAYGTVTKGGNIFSIEVGDNTLKMMHEKLPVGQEMTELSVSGNTLSYKKHIYDDEAMMNGHFEEGSMAIQ
ncbi:DUF4652 domain-containing protein [Massilibacterium senegalense]|uniref:DUF4652 domain-containing protein n=1 Tax=Massilibacterium senegalense TaxID=1632858 RepID=UPI000782D57B|nr:DUF4652 domain-containing protein [Massilibacterium senegalense]